MPVSKPILAALVLNHRRRQKQRHRRYWVCPINERRQKFGEFWQLCKQMRAEEPEKFVKYFRMDPDSFDYLLGLIKPLIQKTRTNFRAPIPPDERLAVTLRYLATGDSQQTIAFSFRLGKATVSRIVAETCEAIWSTLSPLYLKAPSTTDFLRIAADFEVLWQFPHCVSAIDGKHVVIQAPKLSGSEFFSYKHCHSIVLLAACDAQYCFTFVDVGGAGRQSDSGLFSSSPLGVALEEGSLPVPTPCPLPNSDTVAPYFLIADEGFPLKSYMLRPFPGRDLTVERRVYNYRLCRARRVIENAFGICAARFRIFRRPIVADLPAIDAIVKAICCLHNYLMMERSARYCPAGFCDREDRNGGVAQGEWRRVVEADGKTSGLRDVAATNVRNYNRQARDLREDLVKYFCSHEGEVSWQYHVISRGCDQKL